MHTYDNSFLIYVYIQKYKNISKNEGMFGPVLEDVEVNEAGEVEGIQEEKDREAKDYVEAVFEALDIGEGEILLGTMYYEPYSIPKCAWYRHYI